MILIQHTGVANTDEAAFHQSAEPDSDAALHQSHIMPGALDWVLDTGTTRHSVCAARLLNNKRGIEPIRMVGATQRQITVNTVGTARIGKVQLNNVLLMPNGVTNLISVTRCFDAGAQVVFSATGANAVIKIKGAVVMRFTRRGNLYLLNREDGDDSDDSDAPEHDFDVKSVRTTIPKRGASSDSAAVTTASARQQIATQRAANAAPSSSSSSSKSSKDAAQLQVEHAHILAQLTWSDDGPELSMILADDKIVSQTSDGDTAAMASAAADILHARLGHLHSQAAAGCESCIVGTAKRRAISKQTDTAKEAVATLDRLLSDLFGPVSHTIDGSKQRVPTLGGSYYGNVTIDEKSRYIFMALLALKSDAASGIVQLCNTLKTFFGKTVKEFHSDNGGEFMSDTLKQYFASQGITHTTTTANTPAHNGIAERTNGILFGMARAMMHQCQAPAWMWGEAVMTAAYIRNRSPLKKLDGKSPFEMLHGTVPDTSKLRVFGCDAFVVPPLTSQGKLDARAVKCMLVGYSEQQNAWRLYNPDTNKITVSRDVTFVEQSFTVSNALTNGSGKWGGIEDWSMPSDGSQHSVSNALPDDTTAVNPPLTASIVSVDSSTDVVIDDSHADIVDADFDSIADADDAAVAVISHSDRFPSMLDSLAWGGEAPVLSDIDSDCEHKYDSEFISDSPTNAESQSDRSTGIVTAAELESSATPVVTRRSGRHSVPVMRYGGGDPRDYASSDRHVALTACESSINDWATHISMLQHDSMTGTATPYMPTRALADTSMLTWKQALNSPESREWQLAMDEEWASLAKQNVATSVACPSGVRPLKCRWLYKVKCDEHNMPVRYKARVVVQGFRQQYGIDYEETFAPVAKAKSIKMLLSLATVHDWEIKQLDFDAAFLNAPLSEDVYVIPPPGAPSGAMTGSNPIRSSIAIKKLIRSGVNADTVWKLNKALYGLKQAPREWNIDIDLFIKSLGYTPTDADPCIYVKHTKHGTIVLCLYVDDTIAAYPKSAESVWLDDKAAIAAKYSIKDLGDCQWILNMSVTRDRAAGTLALSQQAYVERMLTTFNMPAGSVKVAANPCITPDLTAPVPISNTGSGALLDEMQHSLYRTIVGSLLYAANMTRVDIAYTVGILARHVAAPQVFHLVAAKHVLRYLAGTADYALWFKRAPTVSADGSSAVVCYSDSNWGGDLTDRKSTSGSIVKVLGNAVSWHSKKQTSVALSSAEAEYMALSATTQEALWTLLWVSQVLGTTGVSHANILCDAQSAIAIAQNDVHHQRTKHIDMRHHFVRDHIKKGHVQLVWVPTQEQHADILTKCMPVQQFNLLVSHMLKPVALVVRSGSVAT